MMSSVSSADRFFRVLFFVAFVLSIFHYVDNAVRYDNYALNPDGFLTRTIVTSWVQIVISWVVFAAAGIFGYIQYFRRHWWAAVGLLALFSVSGLVGIGHYTEAPPTRYDALQNLLIVTDIVAGLAMVGFVVWLVFKRALPAMHAGDPAEDRAEPV